MEWGTGHGKGHSLDFFALSLFVFASHRRLFAARGFEQAFVWTMSGVEMLFCIADTFFAFVGTAPFLP